MSKITNKKTSEKEEKNIPIKKLNLYEKFTSNNILIAIRVRPLNDSEKEDSDYHTIKILHISPESIKKKCVKSFTQYQYENCDEVCDFPSSEIMPISFKTDWFPLKKGKFEDIEVNIPNNYDKILKLEYGEYMELPPEESRFRLAPEEIDFGEY